MTAVPSKLQTPGPVPSIDICNGWFDSPGITENVMVVPMMFFVAAWTYALAVNFATKYRDAVDKFHMTKIGVETGSEEGE